FAIAVVVSWRPLFGGRMLRAAHGWDIAVTIGGGIHGFIFLSYGVAAVLMAKHKRWTALPATSSIVSPVIPYATVPVDIWLQRSGRLDGDWRRTATEDPRDHTWHDRLLRWVINHALLSILLGLVIVVVV